MTFDVDDAKISALWAVKWVGSFVVGVWVRVPLPMQSLAVLMIIDFVCGNFAARNEGVWNAEEGRRGLRRKAMSVFIVMACSYASDATNLGINIGKLLATAMSINELGSIFNNCDRAGVEVPQVALDFFVKLRNAFGSNASSEKLRRETRGRKKE